MKDQIRAYIVRAFTGLPQTPKILELQEELISNMLERYAAEIAGGKTEEEAFRVVIDGLGDLSELVESVRPQPFPQPSYDDRKRRAILVAGAVVLFVLSPFMAMVLSAIGLPEFAAVAVMFLFIAAGIGLLIFNHMTRPAYVRAQDTVVEEFKEWRVQGQNQKSALSAFSGAYWTLVTAVYLVFSFVFGHWATSWLIFLLASGVYTGLQGLSAWNRGKRKKAFGLFSGTFWTLLVFVYFWASFTFGIWAFSWILFVIGAAVQSILKGILDLSGVR